MVPGHLSVQCKSTRWQDISGVSFKKDKVCSSFYKHVFSSFTHSIALWINSVGKDYGFRPALSKHSGQAENCLFLLEGHFLAKNWLIFGCLCGNWTFTKFLILSKTIRAFSKKSTFSSFQNQTWKSEQNCQNPRHKLTSRHKFSQNPLTWKTFVKYFTNSVRILLLWKSEDQIKTIKLTFLAHFFNFFFWFLSL